MCGEGQVVDVKGWAILGQKLLEMVGFGSGTSASVRGKSGQPVAMRRGGWTLGEESKI